MRSFEWMRMGRWLAGPTLILVLWQLLAGALGWGGGFVPTPVAVVQTTAIWVFGLGSSDRYAGTWLPAVIASSERVFGGFLVASLVGISVGMLVGRSKAIAD
jgi:NitT/TauT family transport system permease protein